MKTQKKAKKRCSVCGRLLVSAVELEYGLCVEHLHLVEDSPRVSPKEQKSTVSKNPSSIHEDTKGNESHVYPKGSSIHESNNVTCCTRLPAKSAEFLENYAEMLDISLSELIRKTLLEWIEAMK